MAKRDKGVGKAAGFVFETDAGELGRLLAGAFRYACGRRTYAPGIVEEALCDNAASFADPWRAEVIGRVESEWARDMPRRASGQAEARARKAAGDPGWWESLASDTGLGADFDEDGWVRCARFLERNPADDALSLSVWDGDPAPVTASFACADDFWFVVGAALRHDSSRAEADQALGADALLALVTRMGDELNPKWVDNLMRDLADCGVGHVAPEGDAGGLTAIPMPTGDDGAWEELFAFLDAHPERPAEQFWREYDRIA